MGRLGDNQFVDNENSKIYPEEKEMDKTKASDKPPNGRPAGGSLDNPILRYFEYAHLPGHLQTVSKPLCELAERMCLKFPESAEKSAGLRKLLEAKDCFVRCALPD